MSQKDSNLSKNDDVSESVKKMRFKCGGPLAAAWDFFMDFSSGSTIHGVKYLGERNRHWTERVFWVVAFLISALGCFMTIAKIYEKWQHSPVIVTLAERSTPFWQIPFPAITICPATKVIAESSNISDAYDDAAIKTFLVVNLVCDAIFDVSRINSSLEGYEIVPLLKKIAPNFKNFKKVSVTGLWLREVTGSAKFAEILTEEGICFSYNILNHMEMFKTESLSSDFEYKFYYSHYLHDGSLESTNWTLEKGYNTKSSATYPERVFGPGEKFGLTISYWLDEKANRFGCGDHSGFKIFLHSPVEFPQVSKQYIRVKHEKEFVITVKPNMMTTSEGLANYSPERRQCYFNHERSLQFFKVYTQNNCEQECLANFTLEKCKCVTFSMPRTNFTKICSLEDSICYKDVKKELFQQEIDMSFASNNDETHKRYHCDCLPACTSISYDAELSVPQPNFKGDRYREKTVFDLKIFFKEAQFITSKRSEVYSWTDFMANCGGLLGLFMGFSIMSLIEILYYVTLRLACNLMNRGKQDNLEESDLVEEIKVGSSEAHLEEND